MKTNLTTKKPLFPLGRILATPGALDLLDRTATDSLTLIERHARGDWGDLCDEDRQANVEAVKLPLRIFSSYKLGAEKLWIITEADRSLTTLLRPSDY